MYQRVRINGLLLDPITERPILVLKEMGVKRILPMWIGASEADAIALKLEHIEAPRPMTHDLLCRILETTKSAIKEIRIRELRDNTYFADIIFVHGGKELCVDARPSDAIALAIRIEAPIYVEDSIFEQEMETNDSFLKLDDWLHDLSSEEMGHYEM